MISLQRLFGKDDRFFNLLEASADEAHAGVQALIELLRQKTPAADPLERFASVRRQQKQITQEIHELMLRTLVTSLEHEDIQALAEALYKIPKTIEKFAERYLIVAPHLRDVDFSRHLRLMEQATAQVVAMVKGLRRSAHLEHLREENVKLQNIEGDADKLILQCYRDLYGGGHEPFKVIVLKELYELLEKVVDRCRDAGNVVTHIVLKSS